FADVDAGHRGRNGLEGTAGAGAGLGIPGFQLARPAREPNHEDALLLFVQLTSEGGPDEGAERQRPQRAGSDAAQEVPARKRMFRRKACVGTPHESSPLPTRSVSEGRPRLRFGLVQCIFQWLKRNSADASSAQAMSCSAAGRSFEREARKSAASLRSSALGKR